jgi:glutaconyl-CoA/methylmalonyl-CoA decarboxylase subunit gamma
MIRRFLITVNGKSYEVEVEEVSAFASAPVQQQVYAPAAQPQVAAPVAKPEAAQAAPVRAEVPAAMPTTGTKINAPMPGKILSVKASPGQTVKVGDVLMILEAMKMENEIQAPVAGTVTAIAVTEGASVNAGVLLACIG